MSPAHPKPAVVAFLAVLSLCCLDDKQKYVRAAQLSQALAVASNAKTFVSAYYDDRGKLPASNEEAHLPPAKELAGSYAREPISGVTISEGGIVTVSFDEASGMKDAYLRLIPTVGSVKGSLSWRCATRGFKGIAAMVPQCNADD